MTIPAVEEVGRALSAAPVWFRPFIAVCARAGLRLGEAAGLRLEDVDFLRRTISVRQQLRRETNATAELVAPEFGSERLVSAPAESIALLAGHVRRTGARPGGPIASGCDVVTVQRALGHSSAPITLGVYSHLWPTAEDRTRAAAGDLMAAALGASAYSLRIERRWQAPGLHVCD